MRTSLRMTGAVLLALVAGFLPAQAATAGVATPAAKTAEVPGKTASVPAKTARARGVRTASCTRAAGSTRGTVRVRVSAGRATFVSVSAPARTRAKTAANARALRTLRTRALKSGMRSARVSRIKSVGGASRTSTAFRSSLTCTLRALHR